MVAVSRADSGCPLMDAAKKDAESNPLSRIAGALSHLDSSTAWFARTSVSAVTNMVGAVAEHTRSVAQEIADELCDGAPPDADGDSPQRVDSEAELARATAAITPEQLERVGELAGHPEVFTKFPSFATPGFQVTDEMEWHAKAILAASEPLAQLRYDLVPRRITDDRFWEVYFTQIGKVGDCGTADAPCCTAQHEDWEGAASVDSGAAARRVPWKCVFCSFRNVAEADECDMCGELLRDSQRCSSAIDEENDSYF
eukprot:TRINITY_DN493_c0_g1_i1.p1 TRINITY_DN493_c0_g1~~TRINITY_DN493_c0_g1_i1.p1  ORF type:complete len:256 (+),score=88.09 TRINITY_DN493_c0_g1_i1:84-851(+)